MASSIAAPVARVTATAAVAKQQQQQQRKHVTATRLVNRRTAVTPKAVDANAIVQLADSLEDSIPTIAVVASVVRNVTWEGEGNYSRVHVIDRSPSARWSSVSRVLFCAHFFHFSSLKK